MPNSVVRGGFFGVLSLQRRFPALFTFLYPVLEFFWVFYQNDLSTAALIIAEKIFAAEILLEDVVLSAQRGGEVTAWTFLGGIHSFFIIYYAVKIPTDVWLGIRGGQPGLIDYVPSLILIGVVEAGYVFWSRDELFLPFIDGLFLFLSNLPLVLDSLVLY